MTTIPFSVAMLSWMRPHNVLQLVPAYRGMPGCQQITVFNNNPDAAGDLAPLATLPGVYLVNTSADLGLVSRFAAAALSRTDAVLAVDDDIELPVATVQGLLQHWQAGAHNRLVGLFGRRPDGGRYNTTNAWGDVPIVLTRAVVSHRETYAAAIGPAQTMALELGGYPLGNGEDIVLAAVARRRSRKLNLAVNLLYENRDYDDVHAISVRYVTHVEHRSRVVQWCATHV